MDHSLEIMPSRVDNERPIIPGMVVLPNTWCTIVFPSSFDSCLMECVDLCSI
jgi:hypothetical protein